MPPAPPVLVVDDDAVSRILLRQALVDAGLPTEIVTSGEEALAWLAGTVPSLVLLDLIMPAPDGFEVLRSIRLDPRLEEVPVVVLTALDSDADVARAFELGADDFIRKPFRPVELLARIRSQIRMREYVLELGQKERDSNIVLEITQALASSLDIRTILFTVVRRIAEVARVDRCSIVLVRDEGDVGYVVAASDDRDLYDLPIDVDKYPEIRRVLTTGQPLIIPDVAFHPILDVVRADLPTHAFRSLAILPMTFEDRPLGVLFLRGHNPIALGDHELSLARTITNATAIALRNARMLQTLRNETQKSTSARFEAEQRLKLLERYVDFFNASADGIVVLDAEGHVLFSNPRARELSGRSESEIREAPFSEMLEGSDRQCFGKMFERAEAGGTPPAFDLVLRPPTEGGVVRVVSVSLGRVLRDDQAVLVTLRDVTEERATATELAKTKNFLERVIDSSVDAIISSDLRGNVLLFNRAAERCYGYDAREVVGRLNVRELYPAGTAKEVMRRIVGPELGGAGRLEGLRTDVLDKWGARVPVLLSAALIYEQGQAVGSVGIFTDLRERLMMEAMLEEAQESLRSREKQALLAELAGAAAHELNQPLTSVMGYAELLHKRLAARENELVGSGERTLRGAVEVIVQETERMAEIVRKIGKITRYETKTYVGDARIVDLDRASDEPTGSSPPEPSPVSTH